MILSDNEKSISFSLVDTATLRVDDMLPFLNTLDGVNRLCPIRTIVFDSVTLTMSLKDARTYVVTLGSGKAVVAAKSIADGTITNALSFQIAGSGFWTAEEFLSLHALGDTIVALVQNNGAKGLEINYV